MNDKDDLLVIGAKLAHEMVKILFRELEGRTMEESFKIGAYVFPSLLAYFIDAIIKNDHPNAKIKLLSDIIHMSKMLLHVKDKVRDNNKGDKH